MSPKKILVRVSKIFLTQHIVQLGSEIPFFQKWLESWYVELFLKCFGYHGNIKSKKPNFGPYFHYHYIIILFRYSHEPNQLDVFCA